MKKKTALTLLFIAIAVIIVGIIVILSFGKEEKTFVRVGQVEMREYDVSPKIPGRIDWIKVDEGDAISVGDTIAKLTDRELKAKYFQAEGAVESARAQLNMLIAGARKEEIEMARRQFDAASSQFELAEKTFQRMK
ncbi:MAG TPA: biotin/lipoyl-binding protein, partial [Candidatus Kapabacteria bacterium]|nr:biotin/lipoyl-binding protein [Candidatus Kapabacteria bacterium]